MRVYIAGGWFTPEQEKAQMDIVLAVEGAGIENFNPKVDSKPKRGWDSVYKTNLLEIQKADIVIASTVGKDMGTLFECGYATAAGTPVVYYAPGLDGDFNLMLAKSARRVCTTVKELECAIEDGFISVEYKGEIE